MITRRRGGETVCEAGEQIATIAGGEKGEAVNTEGPKEVVLDKGYHSNEMLVELADWQVRSYCSEPDRGRRDWEGKREEQAAVYANRRDATRPSAASPEYSQASAGACGGVQLGTSHAQDFGSGNTTGPAGL